MPLPNLLGVIGLQWSMHGSCLNALCNAKSGLHLSLLTAMKINVNSETSRELQFLFFNHINKISPDYDILEVYV